MRATLKKVWETIEQIADENPDFNYSSGGEKCYYTYANGHVDDGGGCIVGKALEANGVPRDLLRQIDDFGVTKYTDAHCVLDYLLDADGEGEHQYLSYGDRSHDYYQRIVKVQTKQDSGYNWRSAVEKANEEVDINV